MSEINPVRKQSSLREKSKRITVEMMNWRLLSLAICVGSLLIALPASTPDIGVSAPSTLLKEASTQLEVEKLHQLARSLTVKVLSGDFLGSGIAIERQGQIYTVLTNDHVVKAGNPPYQIQTPDGKIYPAQLAKTGGFDGNDLSLLQFSTTADYTVAKLGTVLKAGDEVFAAGFPFSAEVSKEERFVFRTGKVWLILDKALEGGYQVGYTNDVEKGMSGGPLLNRAGELVGINGMHAYPLWGDPYIFKDGSEPNPSLEEQMSKYSWGIPIETFRQIKR